MADFGCEGAGADRALTVLADKEEVGSDGNTGLNSSFMRYFIADLAAGGRPGTCAMCSAEIQVPFGRCYGGVMTRPMLRLMKRTNSCYVNNGVCVSEIHRGPRQSPEHRMLRRSSWGRFAPFWTKTMFSGRPANWARWIGGGGGTVAMYIANLNVDVVDVGVPVLSMHAPFEVDFQTGPLYGL